MKLWLLRPAGCSSAGPHGHVQLPSGWHESHRQHHAGFLIRAETEAAARSVAQRIAKEMHSNEAFRPDRSKGSEGYEDEHATHIPAWIDPRLSTCTELKSEGSAEVVIVDYYAGG